MRAPASSAFAEAEGTSTSLGLPQNMQAGVTTTVIDTGTSSHHRVRPADGSTVELPELRGFFGSPSAVAAYISSVTHTATFEDIQQSATDRILVMTEKTTGYDLVTFPNPAGAVVVPRRSARGQTYFGFVTQFRHTTLDTTLEFPRGGANAGETHLEAAARELAEETGYVVEAGHGVDLGPIWPDTGIVRSDVRAALFTITGLPGVPSPDETEGDLGFHWLSVGNILGAIASNRIVCGMTLSAWAKVTARRLDHTP